MEKASLSFLRYFQSNQFKMNYQVLRKEKVVKKAQLYRSDKKIISRSRDKPPLKKRLLILESKKCH
jgi:hypothetical protein